MEARYKAYKNSLENISADKLMVLASAVNDFVSARNMATARRSSRTFNADLLKKHKDIYLLAVTALIKDKKFFLDLIRDFKANDGAWPTFKSQYPDSILSLLPEPETLHWQDLNKLAKSRILPGLKGVINQSSQAQKKLRQNVKKKSLKDTPKSLTKQHSERKDGLYLEGIERQNISRIYLNDSASTTNTNVSKIDRKEPEHYKEESEGTVNPFYQETLESSVVKPQNDTWQDIVNNHSSISPSLAKNKERKTQEVALRANQSQFREYILNLYGFNCAVTGCSDIDVLEAAHIKDWSVSNNNDLSNGLCLRADVHKLFDKGLLLVDTNYLIIVSPKILSQEYKSLNGKKIKLPKAEIDWPKKEFIRWRLEKFFLKTQSV